MIGTRLKRLRHGAAESVWRIHRSLTGSTANALLITERNQISASQIYPFYFFRRRLAKELGFDFVEIPLADYSVDNRPRLQGAKAVFIQPWWNIEPDRLRHVVRRARTENPAARIIVLDSFAPLDLRLAQHLGNDIDVYVKKQLFRDRSQYGLPTRGDTNLVDYYGKLYGLDYDSVTFPIPDGFLDKLVVGPGFATSKVALPLFLGATEPKQAERTIDLHARLGGFREGWYGRMRDHARSAVSAIAGIRIAASGTVSHRRYLQELYAAKVCFSPFGFGEVCWRDYEAVMCGSLLLKPDMSHVDTNPDIFQSGKTYVSLRWDFADLEEKLRYYLAHDEEREAITHNAFQVVSDYFRSGKFIDHVGNVTGIARR